jgi:hypothetical protein
MAAANAADPPPPPYSPEVLRVGRVPVRVCAFGYVERKIVIAVGEKDCVIAAAKKTITTAVFMSGAKVGDYCAVATGDGKNDEFEIKGTFTAAELISVRNELHPASTGTMLTLRLEVLVPQDRFLD